MDNLVYKNKMKKHKIIIFLLFPVLLFGQNREKMIIVAYFSFIPQLSAYVEAKANDNIDCCIISVDSTDDFNSIKTKIDNTYKNFHADFLLLVGDYEHIPAYKIEEGLSDIHYTFENENNSNPRMSVGRFSVETEHDLQTMIDRTLRRKPLSKHAVGIASYHKSELTEKTDYEQVHFIGEQLKSKGFTNTSELFSGTASTNPTYRDVIAALQSGATWLNYAGYGSYDGWNTTDFESQHIDSLPDDVELPIILSASCLGGYFANRTCFAEKWLRSTKNENPIGAVAVIMSSNLTDWDATLSAMLVINKNMPPTNGNCRLGSLQLQGYRYIIDSMQRPKEAQCWLLFGDPSLWVYPSAENKVSALPYPTPPPTIYPNPTTGKLIIAPLNPPEGGKQPTIEIFNIMGRKAPLSPPEGGKYSPSFGGGWGEVDISHLSNGLYFLKIDGKIFKIIKQ